MILKLAFIAMILASLGLAQAPPTGSPLPLPSQPGVTPDPIPVGPPVEYPVCPEYAIRFQPKTPGAAAYCAIVLSVDDWQSMRQELFDVRQQLAQIKELLSTLLRPVQSR